MNINKNDNRLHNLNNNNVSEVIQREDNEVGPIMSIKKYNTMIMKSKIKKRINEHKKRRNLFTILKNVFKDFLSENNEEELSNNKNSGSEIKFNLRHRPILKRIIEKDIISPFQNPNTLSNRNNII